MTKISDAVQDAKKWWQSKTIIGTILMILPTVIKLIAPQSNIDIQTGIDEVWLGAEGLAAYADSIFATVQELIGFALAVWGRLKASVGIKKQIV